MNSGQQVNHSMHGAFGGFSGMAMAAFVLSRDNQATQRAATQAACISAVHGARARVAQQSNADLRIRLLEAEAEVLSLREERADLERLLAGIKDAVTRGLLVPAQQKAA